MEGASLVHAAMATGGLGGGTRGGLAPPCMTLQDTLLHVPQPGWACTSVGTTGSDALGRGRPVAPRQGRARVLLCPTTGTQHRGSVDWRTLPTPPPYRSHRTGTGHTAIHCALPPWGPQQQQHPGELRNAHPHSPRPWDDTKLEDPWQQPVAPGPGGLQAPSAETWQVVETQPPGNGHCR